jgi:competence protein ComEA
MHGILRLFLLQKPKVMLKEFFYHNSTERKATAVLIALVILMIALCWVWPYLVPVGKTDFKAFKAEVEAFKAGLYSVEEEEENFEKKRYPKKYYSKSEKQSLEPQDLNPFPFNPNTADKTTLLELGLSEKLVKGILNYREKGAVFKTKSDFSKIYNLKPEDFEVLKDFIQLPDSIEKKSGFEKKSYQKSKPEIPILDINRATAAELDKLPSIGSSFADRIVKYRNSLGGFQDLAQLEEIYGLSDSILAVISPYLNLSNSEINKININTCSVEALKSHPYLRWRHASAIVKYREKNGPYKSVEMLRTLHEFNDAEGTYWKIRPYLRV